jgi:hypothetical protein
VLGEEYSTIVTFELLLMVDAAKRASAIHYKMRNISIEITKVSLLLDF